MMPSIERIRFVSSGTEATLSAVRLARGYTGRSKIVKFAGCYHGHGDSFLIAAGSGALTAGVPNSPGVTEGVAADTIVLAVQRRRGRRSGVRRQSAAIAALIVEPYPGNMGLVLPRPGYLAHASRALHPTRRGVDLRRSDDRLSRRSRRRAGTRRRTARPNDARQSDRRRFAGLRRSAAEPRSWPRSPRTGPVYQAGTLSGNPIAMAAGIATLGSGRAGPRRSTNASKRWALR